MRTHLVRWTVCLGSLVLAACGAEEATSAEGTTSTAATTGAAAATAASSGSGAAPGPSFEIVTPEIEIASGDERTYCYYTSVDVDDVVGVKRWSSTMSAGSHHLIVYFTEGAQEPDGTIVEDCGTSGSGGDIPIWTYSAQTSEAENVMPEGVGMRVRARQHLFVQMHYFNPTAAPIDAHVSIKAETYEPGETYVPASAFITFNTQIDLPPHGTGSAEGTCRLPKDAKFFTLSTHAHRRAVRTWVNDGPTKIFESEDWEHPGATDWRAAPYTFSGHLTYHCDYQNDLDQQVTTGDSADTDEMCMAVGYFYPADAPVFCLNSNASN